MMTEARIHLLSASVANQIAAGEVIERPASVVKELLENALDAKASSVTIDIGFGGLNQVKISDNGIGIVADDLPLAVAAHATSKINTLNDLYAIHSMGFRGEALASIASVSRLSLSSRPADQPHAMMLRIEGDTVTLAPCARSQGTTIDVRDIFFNAPVRKKFLKTERSEYLAIEAVVKRFALCAPEVALTLTHNDKQTLALPAALCEQTHVLRIQKLLGKTFIDHAIYLDVERAGMRLQGWVSGRGYQRSQNDQQWIYINRRMVKDKLMNHALKQAYEGLLHPGRHSACVLYLTIPTEQVDVNVHPTKHEVRFQQPRLVHDLMTSQIVQALAAELQKDDPVSASPEISEPRALASGYPRQNDRDSDTSNETMTKVGYLIPTPKPSHWEVRESYRPLTRPWLILNTHYAIIHLLNEPWLLNIELLQRHQLTTLLAQQTVPWASRPLLVPVSYSIDKSHYALIERMLPMLVQGGIQCDFVSESKLMVRTIPQWLPSIDIPLLLRTLNHEPSSLSELFTILTACQAVDARLLSQDDTMALMAYLQTIPDAWSNFGVSLTMETCKGLLHG